MGLSEFDSVWLFDHHKTIKLLAGGTLILLSYLSPKLEPPRGSFVPAGYLEFPSSR